MNVLDLFSGIGGFSVGLEKSDLPQSHSAKSNLTAKASSESIGLTRQSIMMSENSPETSSEQMDLFAPMSSSEDTPVSHSPRPGSKEARRMTVTSGLRCADLLPTSDPLGAFSRMLLVTSNWASTRCFLTWKEKVTPQGHLLFQLAPSMPRTNETASGLLHTPTAKGNQMAPSMSSGWQPVMWLTPNANMSSDKPENMRRRAEKNGYQNGTKYGSLVSQVKYGPPMWATPRAANAKGTTGGDPENINNQRRSDLRDQVAMWPTPVTTDFKGARKAETFEKTGRNPMTNSLADAVAHTNPAPEGQLNGSLNPTWVEWLMGFPLGHTELKHWETRSSRKSPSKSDE